MDYFTFSFEVGAFKPDPHIYQHVCEGLDIPPSHAIFIGDTALADGKGPEDYGMTSEIIKRGEGDTLFSALDRALKQRR